MSRKILRLPKVLEVTGKRKTGLYAAMNANEFPKSFSIGGRAVGWLEEEVEQWIGDRANTRRAA